MTSPASFLIGDTTGTSSTDGSRAASIIRKKRAATIIGHIDDAQARASGRNVTDLSDADLLADLRNRRLSA